MDICEKCVFFRRARPRSQLLAAVVDTTDAAVSAALGKIVEDEQKQREEEAKIKQAKWSTGQQTWPRQPVMSSYCGRRESEGIYLIAELKNTGGHCDNDDFEEGRPERKACSDCRHRIAAVGLERDRQRQAKIIELHAEATSAQASTSGPEGMLKAQREGVPARKAFELSGAYSADGRLPARPEYLDHCSAFTTDDEYAVCAIINPHNTCPNWESAPAGEAERGWRTKPAGRETTSAPAQRHALGWPRSIADRLRQIHEEQKREAEEVEETDPILAEQIRAQQQLTYASLATKLSDIEAQTQAQIINNMK